jgi:hypothetical protein
MWHLPINLTGLQYEIYWTDWQPFYIRYKEHFLDFKNVNGKSKFAQHLLKNKHSIRRMDDIMYILHVTKRGGLMNTFGRFYIYNETILDNQSAPRSATVIEVLRGYPMFPH